jgi:DNA-binding YbaB/EbfC family protein
VNPQQMQQALRQAQQMQERIKREAVALRVEGTAGGGIVTATVDGEKQLLALKLDPDAVSKDDVDVLQDAIVAAVNDANRKADEAMKAKTASFLPPGLRF